MKTREEIYEKEGAALLRILSTYHTLTYEQVIRTFDKKTETIQNLVSNLVKQGRIFYDSETGLLCDRPERIASPDYGMIAAYWVLLDFGKALVYHTSGEFPITITFFSEDDEYEIIYVQSGKELLINRVLSKAKESANRLLIVSSLEQARQIQIPNVIAFCTVGQDGKVSYYRKGR
ncbi:MULTISPECIES: DUF5697 family protein [Lachnospiraceae]|uniref:DUF5697 family protein n=1 Tax=Lachnospiraceae TaxID=186803 RepID=UPI00210F175B|nr:DUF5697 family protein [Blautia producta]